MNPCSLRTAWAMRSLPWSRGLGRANMQSGQVPPRIVDQKQVDGRANVWTYLN